MKIGDIVFYPMHGAGEIVGVEDNEVGGVIKSYYVLKLPMGSLKLMLPVDKIDQIGLRSIISSDKINEVKAVLQSKPDHMEGSWNKRFNIILERMKTGNILEVTAVARNLSLQHKKRKISSGERRLMELSRQILISELVFACKKSPEEITKWVDNNIDCAKN
ncbi:MAG: CarD family transcriptional regulator [Selenomonadaceae bacterium]|nr:CarD family transcriptional regulator [Selenomonadaceae bacterium]MBR1859730.1 CarD family transcriptional regulator [Selenomonadaceae bacterium]